jgi:hypothetical protein
MKKLLLSSSFSRCDNLGPTVNATNTNTNTNTNTIDLHDLINFAPVPNPTAPVPILLQVEQIIYYSYRQRLKESQGFAAINALLQRECQAILARQLGNS